MVLRFRDLSEQFSVVRFRISFQGTHSLFYRTRGAGFRVSELLSA